MRNSKITSLIVSIAKVHKNWTGARLRDLGLFIGQDIFISHLSKVGSASQRQVADVLRVEQATISEMVKKLEAAGLVKRERDPEDRRAFSVALTAKGREVAKDIEIIWSDLEQITTASFSKEERETLERLLTKAQISINQAPK